MPCILRRINNPAAQNGRKGFVHCFELQGLYFYKAFFGQAFAHSIQRMHSVPFSQFLELSVISTFIGRADPFAFSAGNTLFFIAFAGFAFYSYGFVGSCI